MRELQLPICALVFSLLLCIIYFSKKRLKTPENKIYGVMLLMGTIDSLIVTLERYVVRSGNIEDVTPLINVILQITNRIDFISLIILCSCLFLYTLLITIPSARNKISNIIKTISIIDLLSFVYIILFNVELITSGKIISVSGGGIIPSFAICGLYVIGSILIPLLNFKKINKKHIPMLSIIFIFIFLMIIFNSDPYIMIISITVTFVNYLMYFTIENPDLSVVNELIRNKELVEQQTEDKSYFLFEMSQDIKIPARNILDLSKKYNLLEEEKEKKEIVRNIGLNASELIFKTNNILDVSSMDANLIKIIDEEYNPYKLFNEVKVFLKDRLQEKNTILKIDINNNMPLKLAGDYFRLKQVLMAILINSCNNTNDGCINIIVDSITKYNVCRLIIKIEDNGRGMNIEKINGILDNLKNIEKDDIQKLDKLDVHLPLAIKIIKLMGGNVHIKSEKDNGTLITIVIDQKSIEKNDSNVMKKISKYSFEVFGKKRILLVDANKDELFMMKTILGRYNVDVNSTMIAKECIDRITSGEIYNLIIIDDELRNSSALGVLNELKTIKDFKSPVAIILSKEKEHMKKYYKNDGFKYFVLKEDLEQELEKLVSKYL